MENYNLTPDMVKEHLVNVQYRGGSKKTMKDPFSGVSTQTKAALTRTYNQKHKDSLKKKAKSKAKLETEGNSHLRTSYLTVNSVEYKEDSPLEDQDRGVDDDEEGRPNKRFSH